MGKKLFQFTINAGRVLFAIISEDVGVMVLAFFALCLLIGIDSCSTSDDFAARNALGRYFGIYLTDKPLDAEQRQVVRPAVAQRLKELCSTPQAQGKKTPAIPAEHPEEVGLRLAQLDHERWEQSILSDPESCAKAHAAAAYFDLDTQI